MNCYPFTWNISVCLTVILQLFRAVHALQLDQHCSEVGPYRKWLTVLYNQLIRYPVMMGRKTIKDIYFPVITVGKLSIRFSFGSIQACIIYTYKNPFSMKSKDFTLSHFFHFISYICTYIVILYTEPMCQMGIALTKGDLIPIIFNKF